MKRFQTILMISIISLAGTATLMASPTAEKLYTTTQSLSISSQTLDSFQKSYGELTTAVNREAQNAAKELWEARNKGDRDEYLKAVEKLNILEGYQITQEQSDAYLQSLLQADEAKQTGYAAWLYQNSPYYRPRLTLDFSASGETYQFSYNQQVGMQPGSEITLPDASQLRMNTADVGVLVGWGLTKDSVTYQPGQKITMPYTDQTLYAIYEGKVVFTDSANDTEVSFPLNTDGSAIDVPKPTSKSGSAVFAGWYDFTTRELLVDQTQYTPKGMGAQFEALWKDASIGDVTSLYFDGQALPTNTQLGVGFSYQNTGTIRLNGLKAQMKSDSPYVSMLTDTLYLGSLPAGQYSTNNSRYNSDEKQAVSGEANTFRFVIKGEAPSGTVVPFTLTLTNDKGDTWSQTFELKTK